MAWKTPFGRPNHAKPKTRSRMMPISCWLSEIKALANAKEKIVGSRRAKTLSAFHCWAETTYIWYRVLPYICIILYLDVLPWCYYVLLTFFRLFTAVIDECTCQRAAMKIDSGCNLSCTWIQHDPFLADPPNTWHYQWLNFNYDIEYIRIPMMLNKSRTLLGPVDSLLRSLFRQWHGQATAVSITP